MILIVDDLTEQRRIARNRAAAQSLPPKVMDHALALSARERLAHVYPIGVQRGAIIGLRALVADGHRLPKGMPSPRDEAKASAWADGLAAGMRVPPRAAFGSEVRREMIAAAYRAGITAGIMATLERAGLVRGT